ncbi:DNA-methyltransferase [Nocardia abscessus]|uniref:DNA-methyltransferase n=1 Tax=Nocardia abscessus TaxID=120957 RepID=UPI0024587FD7|nr:site-specific DNA-methyltransferase [Nocardia abscessus]
MTAALRNRLVVGDALEKLRELPDFSVDMVLTSPPYFRLRNYDAPGQIGLEAHVDDWVNRLSVISDEIRRALVPTGTYWLNLGDTYSTHRSQGAPRKSLLMAPERLALQLQRSGWIVRNKIIWAKPNPMPVSVRDRLACTYEFIYVLAKQPDYYFDLDAIRAPHRSGPSKGHAIKQRSTDDWRGPNSDSAVGLDVLKREGRVGHPLGKNPGDVWQLATANFRGAHHAVFPVHLASRAIQAGCPELRCTSCRRPWRRRVIRLLGGKAMRTAASATCHCDAPNEPGLVLDPFIGSGTTAVAAEQFSRTWCGIELNPDFARLAIERIETARVNRHQGEPRASPPAAA